MADSTYKLTYFNVKFYAEPIKYIFAYADVPFEDVRIEHAEWPDMKESTPFGKVPVLEVDGKKLSQSVAICRYLGKRFGLATRDPVKEAFLEAVIDNFKDVLNGIQAAYATGDWKEKAPEIARDTFLKLDDLLANGFFYGSDPTWVDIYMAGMVDVMGSFIKGLFNPYPNLRTLCYKIGTKQSLKKYLANRLPYPEIPEVASNVAKIPEEDAPGAVATPAVVPSGPVARPNIPNPAQSAPAVVPSGPIGRPNIPNPAQTAPAAVPSGPIGRPNIPNPAQSAPAEVPSGPMGRPNIPNSAQAAPIAAVRK